MWHLLLRIQKHNADRLVQILVSAMQLDPPALEGGNVWRRAALGGRGLLPMPVFSRPSSPGLLCSGGFCLQQLWAPVSSLL